MRKYQYIFILFTLVFTTNCHDALDVQPASQFSDDFLNTSSGMRALLNSAYDNIQYTDDPGVNRIYIEEATSGVLVNFRGLLNRDLQFYQDFTFNSTTAYIQDQLWAKPYRAIRDANLLIDNIEINPDLSENEKSTFLGEARFIRGLAYHFLYGWFGPVPLIKQSFNSPNDNFEQGRATDDEILSFIEEELLAAAAVLPATQLEYGRATKGAALGVLTKYYLQNRLWDKAANAAKQVMDLNKYTLWPDYTTLFALQNEGNSEMVFAFPAIPLDGNGNVWVANALPPQYPTPIFNTATQVTMPVAFYNTFEANDNRKKLILTEYVSNQGQKINLLTGVEYQNPRSLKYPIDLSADSRSGGADFILIRYADILLARAEALVMASGNVSTEALALLNEIRIRAGLSAYKAADIPTQAAFIDALLKERSWEFYSEGKYREDLLRHDRFIQHALNRGKAAKSFHIRFPLPQSELNANPNLKQNTGY